MGAKKRITVEVDEKLHRNVRIKAAMECRRIKDVVIDLLKAWLKRK